MASDDGRVYCLDGLSGAILWKFRAVPDERRDYRLLGNERMISRWPVRVAPTVHDGRLYFASGLWPSEGVYVFCLDAASGKQLWVNRENSSIEAGLNDHGRHVDFGLSPNGYGAVCGSTFAVPSGRALNAFHDLLTGEREPYTTGYGKADASVRGTWHVSAANNYYCLAGQMFAIDVDRLPSGRPLDWISVNDYITYTGLTEEQVNTAIQRRELHVRHENGSIEIHVKYKAGQSMLAGRQASRFTPNEQYFVDRHPKLYDDPLDTAREIGLFEDPVFGDGELYVSLAAEKSEVTRDRGEFSRRLDAWNRVVCRDMTRPQWRLTPGPSVIRRIEFPEKWSIECPLKIFLKAGSKLYGGALNTVGAITLPETKDDPPVASWTAPVEGRVHRMLAAGNHLIVVTEEGGLYAFGDGPKAAVSSLKRAEEREIATDGVIVQMGWDQGADSEELIRSTRKHLIVLESDASKIDELRASYSQRGLYGSRLHLIHQTLSVELAPYCADRVIASGIVSFDAASLRRILDLCRPFGGKVEIAAGAVSDELLRSCNLAKLGFEQETDGAVVRLTRVRAPNGAGRWTHEEADAANTSASEDVLVKPPFAVLWFSGSIDREFSPEWDYTHYRNPIPLVDCGRMFIIAENRVYAMDVYTGRHLWSNRVPASEKTRHYRDEHRRVSRPNNRNHLLVGDEYLYFDDYVAWRFDQETGRLLGRLTIPASLADAKAGQHPWAEVRAYQGDVICSVGPVLARIDPKSGDVKWKYSTADFDGFTFALGGDRVFAVDYLEPERFRRTAAKDMPPSILRALELGTGRELWRRVVARPKVTEETMKDKFKAFNALVLLNTAKPILGYNHQHDALLVSDDRNGLFACAGADGKVIWRHDQTEHDRGVGFLTILPDLFWMGPGSPWAYDIRSGERRMDLGATRSSCGRYLGSPLLITCRNNTASFFDLEAKQQIAIPNVRSGCSNSMIPAGGVLNAFNSAHGCNCNYPLFCSYAMVHFPEAARFEPKGLVVQPPPKPSKEQRK